MITSEICFRGSAEQTVCEGWRFKQVENKRQRNRRSLIVCDYNSLVDLKQHICSLPLRHYRPIYFTLPNMPQINLRTLPPCSPFLVDDKDPPGNKRRGHRWAASVWIGLILASMKTKNHKITGVLTKSACPLVVWTWYKYPLVSGSQWDLVKICFYFSGLLD